VGVPARRGRKPLLGGNFDVGEGEKKGGLAANFGGSGKKKKKMTVPLTQNIIGTGGRNS